MASLFTAEAIHCSQAGSGKRTRRRTSSRCWTTSSRGSSGNCRTKRGSTRDTGTTRRWESSARMSRSGANAAGEARQGRPHQACGGPALPLLFVSFCHDEGCSSEGFSHGGFCPGGQHVELPTTQIQQFGDLRESRRLRPNSVEYRLTAGTAAFLSSRTVRNPAAYLDIPAGSIFSLSARQGSSPKRHRSTIGSKSGQAPAQTPTTSTTLSKPLKSSSFRVYSGSSREDAMAAIIKSIRRGRGSRFAARTSATNVP